MSCLKSQEYYLTKYKAEPRLSAFNWLCTPGNAGACWTEHQIKLYLLLHSFLRDGPWLTQLFFFFLGGEGERKGDESIISNPVRQILLLFTICTIWDYRGTERCEQKLGIKYTFSPSWLITPGPKLKHLTCLLCQTVLSHSWSENIKMLVSFWAPPLSHRAHRTLQILHTSVHSWYLSL